MMKRNAWIAVIGVMVLGSSQSASGLSLAPPAASGAAAAGQGWGARGTGVVGPAPAVAGGPGLASSAVSPGESRSAVVPQALVVGQVPEQGASEPMLFDDNVIRDVRLTFPRDDWIAYLGCQSRAGERPGGTVRPEQPARLEVDGVVLADVGVRCKGNSSLGIRSDKKPLNITTDAFVPGQALWGYDVINLDNNWSDPSQLRAAIALRLLREYMPAPRFSFARVTIQGRCIGLYTMTEQVSGEFAEAWYPNDDGIVIKGDSPVRIAFNSSTLQWLGESLAPYKQGYEVKGRAAASDDGYVALREIIRALDAPTSAGGLDPAGFAEGIWRKIDVETALWYLATSNLIDNFDSYYVGKNYFMYIGGRDPRLHMIPWDLGLSFGVFGLQMARTPGQPGEATPPARVDPFVQENEVSRPLIRRLLAVPEYRADYLAHYRALLEEVYNRSWIETVAKRYQDLVRDAARQEAQSYGSIGGAYSFAQFEQNLYDPVGGGAFAPGLAAPGILTLVAERRAFLTAREDMWSPDVRISSHQLQPEKPTAADAVLIAAHFAGGAPIASVQLRYRVAGGYENKLAMTRQADGSYRATIPAQRQGTRVSYVFRVGLADGRSVFFPSATLTRPYFYDVLGVTLPRQAAGDLVINELMSDNQSAIADEAGEYDDWVELYNRGSLAVRLDGYYLSDKEDDPWAFALPDISLEPGERLLVWCDNDPEQGPLHADFGLSKNGEQLLLSTLDATVDLVRFGPLRPDESLMRLPDGSDNWIVCLVSTPLRPNVCRPEAIATPTEATGTPGTPPSPPATTQTPPITPSLTATRTATAAGPTPIATAPTPGVATPTVAGQAWIYMPFSSRH